MVTDPRVVVELAREVERLAAFQARTKRWATAVGIAALVLGALGLANGLGGEPRTVEAERFVLRDAEGRERVILATGVDGAPEIVLVGTDGTPKARLALAKDDRPLLRLDGGERGGTVTLGYAYGFLPSLSMAEGDGSLRMALGMEPHRGVSLHLYDGRGKPRSSLKVHPDGAPFLDLFDRTGKVRLGMSVLERGSSGLSLWDGAGRPRVGLVVEPDGHPGLDLYHSDSNRALRLAVDTHGSPSVAFTDDGGGPRMALAVTPAGDAGLNVFEGGPPRVRMTLGVRQNGDANLTFAPFDGKPLAEIGATPKGGPGGKAAAFLALRQPGGTERVQLLAIDGEHSQVRLTDASGANRAILSAQGRGPAGLVLLGTKGEPVLQARTGVPGEPAAEIILADESGREVHRVP